MLNVMTVDVEDYFHASAFADSVSPADWTTLQSRVVRNTDRLLEIFDHAGVRATFFVLGWVAEQFPDLISRIAQAGHELASHSYDHGLVYHKTPEVFRADLRRAAAAIESAAGVKVEGFRAPTFSITERSLWALDTLISEGYTFDSSIYPIRHDRYGIPAWPRHVHRVGCASGSLWELPGSTIAIWASTSPWEAEATFACCHTSGRAMPSAGSTRRNSGRRSSTSTPGRSIRSSRESAQVWCRHFATIPIWIKRNSGSFGCSKISGFALSATCLQKPEKPVNRRLFILRPRETQRIGARRPPIPRSNGRAQWPTVCYLYRATLQVSVRRTCK